MWRHQFCDDSTTGLFSSISIVQVQCREIFIYFIIVKFFHVQTRQLNCFQSCIDTYSNLCRSMILGVHYSIETVLKSCWCSICVYLWSKCCKLISKGCILYATAVQIKDLKFVNFKVSTWFIAHLDPHHIFRFGSGIVIYWFGYIKELDIHKKQGIALSNGFPQKSSLVLLANTL